MINMDERGRQGSSRVGLGVGIVATVLLATADAHAQGGARRVGAEPVFADGRRLMAAGDYERACPKLAASQKLDPAIGAVLNLGACYEKAGKIASAMRGVGGLALGLHACAAQRHAHREWVGSGLAPAGSSMIGGPALSPRLP
jgi:hypothetical protein